MGYKFIDRAKNYSNRKFLKPIKRQIVEPFTINYRKLSSVERMLPDFIIIGAQKSGTTSLYSYLSEHPLVKFSWKKEPDFFSWNYSKGLNWYQSFFPSYAQRRSIEKQYMKVHNIKGTFRCAEASVSYLHHPHAAQRIYQTKPDIKLIVILRNPVDRCFSGYWHSVNKDYEHLTFVEAIRNEESRLAPHFNHLSSNPFYVHHDLKNRQYLTIGHYEKHLSRYYEWFARDQILVLDFEKLILNAEGLWKDVLHFLELPYYGNVTFQKVGFGKYDSMSDYERKLAESYYINRLNKPYNIKI